MSPAPDWLDAYLSEGLVLTPVRGRVEERRDASGKYRKWSVPKYPNYRGWPTRKWTRSALLRLFAKDLRWGCLLERSRIFVFDCDGKPRRARKFLAKLETPVCETPKGFHVYVRMPPQTKRGFVNPEWVSKFLVFQKRLNGVGLSVDAKTIALTGFRYSMLPPSRISRHRKYPNWRGCRGNYRWLNVADPQDFRVEELK